MAGLFGSGSPAQVYDPTALAPMDRLTVLGAMLKDIGNGGQSDNLLNVRQMLLGQQLARSQMGLIGAALGGDDGGGTPQASAVPVGAPAVPGGVQPVAAPAAGAPGLIGGSAPSRQNKALAAMALLKGDASGAYNIMNPELMVMPDGTVISKHDPSMIGHQFANRANVNGTIVNLNDPNNTNRVIPEAPVKGAMPVYDNLGHVVDWSLPAGSANVIRQNAQAAEDAKAADDIATLNLPNGSTLQRNRLLAARGLGGGDAATVGVGGVAPGAEVGQVGLSQSPAEKALAEKRAETQAQREQLQPKELGALQDLDNTSNQTSQIVHQMLGDVLDPRTGQWVPGGKPQATGWTTGAVGQLLKDVPGTPQHDLDEQLEHLRAMTSMEQLQNLRDNSPTGAGLGRVTQQEINLLAAMRGSTDQGQSLPQFNQNMRRQLTMLDQMIANRRKVYNETYGNIEQPQPGQTAPKAPAYAAPSREALMAEARRRGLIH